MEWFDATIAASSAIGTGVVGSAVAAIWNWLSKREIVELSHTYDSKLEVLKSELTSRNNEQLSKLNTLLDISQELHLEGHKQKLGLYKSVIDPIVDLLSDLESIDWNDEECLESHLSVLMDRFYPLRIKVLSHLALFAPVEVFQAVEEVLNCLFLMLRQDEPYSLKKIDDLGIAALNVIRRDIDISPGTVGFKELPA